MIRTDIIATSVALDTVICKAPLFKTTALFNTVTSCNILRHCDALPFRALRFPSYLSAFLAFSRCYSSLW
ncbi:hypothetical protein HMPREF0454_01123 [Hafnia alvei ATCC 51873]|uniref:Uncharacterized protein n=1 Tax=Hafnia alvei ATCC 51873 TaxID=1002364 RepID=G9Y3C1_HAFAL|nr:hypothetical protein F652_4103 [Enterobacteriaceae bacterium bta3-1]EHM45584.1 hypothetical protein HMPREF0454_01123 [Hafnia alvei ATCC 51873]